MRKKRKYFNVYAPVFYPSALIILAAILLSFFFGSSMTDFLVGFQSKISENAGWFFILCTNILVIAAFYFAFSKYGNIRLGGQDARPEFSTFAWFSMLFAAGIGIGLLFYGVAEPVSHFHTPPLEVANDVQRAEQAMLYTLLHWGFHGWGPYVILGLALAFFTYNKKLPLTISSLFFPLIGNRIYGWQGNVIDILAVVTTLFGLATSLGMGVQQVAAGLDYLFGVPGNINTQILLIIIITFVATISVVSGLNKGIRLLSVIAMRTALIFLITMLLLGPTVYILDSFVQNTGHYLNSFFKVGTWADAYTQSNWQNDWTIFYWAWWISWSPFVGMFIARISKGRTVREFILGVMLAPVLIIFLWLSTFGGTAIYMEVNNIGNILEAINTNLPTALFAMLAEFPFSTFTSLIAIFLIIILFVTSSDSGSLVVDSITSGRKKKALLGQRIFWAVAEGAVAAALLYSGGLKALQSAVISIGLPFAVLLIVIVYALYIAFKDTTRLK